MTDHWTDRLSEYMDGDLGRAEREACEAHLARCSACSEVLEELEAVVAGAARLPDLPPSRDLWPDIEGRLTPRTTLGAEGDAGASEAFGPKRRATRVLTFPTRRVSLTIPQLAAAAIATVMISAGSVWLLVPGAPSTTTAVATTAPGAAVPVALNEDYQQTVRDLEAEFERRRADLDPETIRVVESNLAIIDRAIAEAGAALLEDPSSEFLHTHLASAMRQKVELLRQAATIETTEI